MWRFIHERYYVSTLTDEKGAQHHGSGEIDVRQDRFGNFWKIQMAAESSLFLRKEYSGSENFLGITGDGHGGHTRARTLDPLIKSQLLYQLSYVPMARLPVERLIAVFCPG